jgi:hypothetical protein
MDSMVFFNLILLYEDPVFLISYDLLFDSLENKTIFDNAERLLKQSAFGLIQEDSIVINNDMKTIWSVITDWEKFRELVPILGKEVRCERNTDGEVDAIVVGVSSSTLYRLQVVTKCIDLHHGVYSYRYPSPPIALRRMYFLTCIILIRKAVF